MPFEIEAFLSAFNGKFICLPCLGAVTSRDETDVRSTVQMLLAERRAETQVGECLNCNATAFLVGRRRR
jgi:ABC-type transporter lipoprotein component MlaA